MGTNVANNGMGDWYALAGGGGVTHHAGYQVSEHAPASGGSPHSDDYHAELELVEGRWNTLKGTSSMSYVAWYGKHNGTEKGWLDGLAEQSYRDLCYQTAKLNLAWPL